MKKILFFLLLMICISFRLLADDTIVDHNSAQYNTALMESTARLLDAPSFPCSCDCSTMVKSARIYDEQKETELYLGGGYRVSNDPDKRCQKIELNLSACNNQAIPSISFSFPESSDDCLSSDMYIYREDGEDETVYLSSFDPDGGTGVLLLSTPIPPCSSAKVVFYICSYNMDDCEHDDYEMTITVNGQNPACTKSMTWFFDFPYTVPNIRDLDLQNQKYGIELMDCEFRIIDIFNNIVKSGKVETMYDLNLLKDNLSSRRGLYILQVLKENHIYYQEKFIKGY